MEKKIALNALFYFFFAGYLCQPALIASESSSFKGSDIVLY